MPLHRSQIRFGQNLGGWSEQGLSKSVLSYNCAVLGPLFPVYTTSLYQKDLPIYKLCELLFTVWLTSPHRIWMLGFKLLTQTIDGSTD